jgi:hypothetical protein
MAQLNPAITALKQYVPGRFGPEDAIQGPFGRDMSMSQPNWARWFDAVQENAPGGIKGMGGSRANPSVQPGQGDTTTYGLPAGYGTNQFNQEVGQFATGGEAPGFAQTPGGGQATMLPDVQARFRSAYQGLKKART